MQDQSSTWRPVAWASLRGQLLGGLQATGGGRVVPGPLAEFAAGTAERVPDLVGVRGERTPEGHDVSAGGGAGCRCVCHGGQGASDDESGGEQSGGREDTGDTGQIAHDQVPRLGGETSLGPPYDRGLPSVHTGARPISGMMVQLLSHCR